MKHLIGINSRGNITIFNTPSLVHKFIADTLRAHPLKALKGQLISCLLFVVSVFVPVSAQMADPMVSQDKPEKLAAHSWMISDKNIPLVPNVGIIVGSHSTLVIDTGTGPANGEIVHDAALALEPKNKLYLATTHIHPEHDLSASGFPDSTTMIRSESQQREIAADGLALSHDLQNMSPILRELLTGSEFRAADVTYSNSYELDLGGVTVIMMSVGPAHTLGDTAFHVVEDNVLFAGELMVNSIPNLFSQFSHIENWSVSLDKLADLNAETIVPSHGDLVDIDTKSKLQEFLGDLLNRVTELNTGAANRAAVAETLKKELSDKYSDWTSNLNTDYYDRVMQSAASSAFKTLDRRPPAGPEAN